MILQTICGTGIRVSELKYITVEAVKNGVAKVLLKGKNRVVFIVKDLRKKLLYYARKKVSHLAQFLFRLKEIFLIAQIYGRK